MILFPFVSQFLSIPAWFQLSNVLVYKFLIRCLFGLDIQ